MNYEIKQECSLSAIGLYAALLRLYIDNLNCRDYRGNVIHEAKYIFSGGKLRESRVHEREVPSSLVLPVRPSRFPLRYDNKTIDNYK